jgi:hypothetical protein
MGHFHQFDSLFFGYPVGIPTIIIGLVILTLGRKLFWFFVGAIGFVFGLQLAMHYLYLQPSGAGAFKGQKGIEVISVFEKLSRYDALIIDDIGYVQQDRSEMEVLFTLLADRYERSSVMITSNLPFSKWEQIFKDPMVTAAAIDRLVHHSVILELNIESYRMEAAKKKKNKNPDKSTKGSK